MRILLQAFLGTAILRALFFLAAFVVSYIKGLTYRPNTAMYWENAERLPQEAAFSLATSLILYLAMFVVVKLMYDFLFFL